MLRCCVICTDKAAYFMAMECRKCLGKIPSGVTADQSGQSNYRRPETPQSPAPIPQIPLIPIMAWIGLGADGLSSSVYGPEEAFKALGGHTYLAAFLGLATALAVCIISSAYSRIIDQLPHGGGGYIVATHMLGEKAGVVSGNALLVYYILIFTAS